MQIILSFIKNVPSGDASGRLGLAGYTYSPGTGELSFTYLLINHREFCTGNNLICPDHFNHYHFHCKICPSCSWTCPWFVTKRKPVVVLKRIINFDSLPSHLVGSKTLFGLLMNKFISSYTQYKGYPFIKQKLSERDLSREWIGIKTLKLNTRFSLWKFRESY